MYRLHPSYISSLPTDLGYSRPQYSRQRYLSPFTEQRRVIEAQHEEEDLLRRLEEIQLQKQQDRFLRRSPYEEYSPYHSSYPEYEELERAAALRRRQRELECLRREEQEEERLLALKRREEILKLQRLHRLREEEEARLAAIRREAERAEAARQIGAKKLLPCFPQGSSDDQLRHLFGHQTVHRPSSNVDSEPQTLEQLFPDFVKQLNNKQSERTSTPKPAQEEHKKRTPSPAAREGVPSPQTLEEVLRLMFNPQPQVSSPEPEKKISPSSESVVQVFHFYLPYNGGTILTAALQEKPKAIEVEERSASIPDSRPVSSLSLKEQLESRLNNDQSNEIKDTIQAILASLSHAQPPSTTASASSSKGKEKAVKPEHSSKFTAGDAHKAIESIRGIEASLIAIQDEFEFPSEVDFSPSPSRSSSPVRDDVSFASESDTPTLRKLAYTSRNHPIRSYEQALSKLLVQLDEIESHGNADVRLSRKAVVARVEDALEELEQKVEARWNKWNKNHHVEREEAVEKVHENTEGPSQERQVAPAQDVAATVPPEAAPAETPSDLVTEPASPSPPSAVPSTAVDEAEVASQLPSYAEVVRHNMPHSSVLPELSSTLEVDTSPALEVAENITTTSDTEVKEHTEAEPVVHYDAEAFIVEQTEDNVTGTDVQAMSSFTEPEIPTASYPPTSIALEETSSPNPPVISTSSTSSLATLRPSNTQTISDEDLSTSNKESPVSEEGHSSLGEGYEAEIVDTFLLPNNIVSDHAPKQSERDLEDVGSDWSEVEA
ncbi:hypothetical protein J3R30DRAFT_3440314 [Lentinula aciculospora]|uniref:BAG domain-containing protein n=1 Tax=Lentinula aciculospora TaxID=153920 RepID=A0A9W9AL92_9AGAR|nr:hypothetical protein J3R30DRAFT_3440314 [Lentinula aciculospora]